MTNRFRPVLLFAFGLLIAHAATAQSQSMATLRVKTDASDVEVWLDGESVGRTPLTLREIAAGKHRITLLKDGYEDHLQEVEVLPGQPNSVFVVMKLRNVKLPDLPVEFNVVHEHQLKSCRGTLTVTAEALNYKAENDADEFHIPVATIKSVIRTSGGTRGMAPSFSALSTDNMVIRIETPGRGYSFWAFKERRKEPGKVANEKTTELYEIVFRLFTAALAPPQKSKD
ncbi:MAG TPA: PEGA domain-containing protein [Pyrinomonadaceae bacterium]|jgi:hypothetical protein